MKKILLTGLAALFLLAGWFLAGRDERPAPALPDDPLEIGVEADVEPFSYVGLRGELTGFDVEFAREVCRELHRECRIEPLAFATLLPSLKAGELDLVVAGLAKSNRRGGDFLFSEPYYRSGSFFVTTQKRFEHFTPDRIPELVIGVQAGKLQDDYLEERYVPQGARKRAYPSFNALVDALLSGEVNIIFIDSVPGYTLLNSPRGEALFIGGRAENVDAEFTACRVVAKRESRALIEGVNRTLHKLQSNGEFQDLIIRFFPFFSF